MRNWAITSGAAIAAGCFRSRWRLELRIRHPQAPADCENRARQVSYVHAREMTTKAWMEDCIDRKSKTQSRTKYQAYLDGLSLKEIR